MTGPALLSLTLPLMFSSDAAEYPDALPVINLLLADTFAVQNSILLSSGEEALSAIPQISALTDALPYEDEINRNILPYGLAGYLYMEDDANIATQRMNKYEYEKAGRTRATLIEIKDPLEDY